MDVYVETNFVLELALLQEQHESCEKILQFQQTGKIRLIVPAYSLIEPFETIFRYAKNRSRVSNDLAAEIKQLSRTKPYQEETNALQAFTGFLVRSQEEERKRLRYTVDSLTNIAEVISLDKPILSGATRHELQFDMSPQDSIVYASVLEHLRASTVAQKCFLNKNSKDFADPDIVAALKSNGCKILFNFDAGFEYISSQVRAQ
jgi:predicted nucleic acid-binding protein